MNSRRSYLDQLNAGRRRRPSSSIEELTQTLDELESRFRRPQVEKDDGHARQRRFLSETVAREPERDRRASGRDTRVDAYRPAARDSDGLRPSADDRFNAMASEINEFRQELRHQMGTGLRREFSTLKGDIERTMKAAAPVPQVAELGAEFERLSAMIHQMTDRGDDRQISLLRLEMEEVKSALGKLAREETLQSFDRRWSEMADKAGAGLAPDALAGLMARLEQIGDAIGSLPDSAMLRALEDKMKLLSAAVDQFTHRRDLLGPEALEAIEERLDEISRAVAASAAATQPLQFDPQPFERIEARISSLARQIAEVVDDNPSAALIDQLSGLSVRVDDIARRVDMPDHTVARLAEQMQEIARRLDSGPAAPDLGPALEGLEDRVASLSHLLEQRHEDALVHGRALFRDLETRLEEVSLRMRDSGSGPRSEADLIEAMDTRFAALASRLERPVPSVEIDLFRSLEAQVAGLAAHIAAPAAPSADLAQLAPRLESIETSIVESRRDVVEAAREAAEEAVRNLVQTSSLEGPLVAGLMDDLRALETLSRKSDDRNAKTFAAIHDTLLKIVDRLGAIEADSAAAGRSQAFPVSSAPERGATLGADETPSLQPSIEALDDEEALAPARVRQTARSAASAAAEAAADALREDDKETVGATGGGRLSMLGGLTRALSGRKERKQAAAALQSAPAAVEKVEPALDVDAPLDPRVANQPLEPGSGAPDLNAIMKRVRDERGQPSRGMEADAAKSDFIAAARRAAQAAAAEAEVMKRGPSAKGKAKGVGFGGLIKGRSKPVLMGVAAVLMALAALQIGKSFTSGSAEVATAPVAPATLAATAPQAPVEADLDVAGEDVLDQAADRPVRVAGETPPAVVTANRVDEPAASSGEDELSWLDASATSASVRPDPVAGAVSPQAQVEEVLPEPDAEVMAAIPLEAGPVALREAAAAGDPKALFEIGNRYDEGRGVTADRSEAARWYERSAEEGYAPAQYRIGNMLENGLGVARDVPAAKTWYQLAAAQGNASAMHNLAVLFAMGADGTADNDSAARWFMEAAGYGVTDSQYNLGILAAKGVGLPQNLEEAYKWFALVAKAGDKDAAAKRDEIGNALRPEQLERARAAADMWRAKPVDPEANVVEIPDSWQEGGETTAAVDLTQALRNIQQILNANGYDAGSEDGLMGRKTQAAIAKFQADKGMKATGVVDEQLVRALLAMRS